MSPENAMQDRYDAAEKQRQDESDHLDSLIAATKALQECLETERYGASLPPDTCEAAILVIRERGKQIDRLLKRIEAEEKTVEFYKTGMVKIAEAFGITSIYQLIGRAENNTETYVDILVKIIKEKLP